MWFLTDLLQEGAAVMIIRVDLGLDIDEGHEFRIFTVMQPKTTFEPVICECPTLPVGQTPHKLGLECT
jgi:hypothetical protein